MYRINLATNKWCENECEVQRDIVSVSAVQITLEKKEADTTRRSESLNHFINRTNGEHYIFANAGIGASAMVFRWQGKCVPSAFTGFPMVDTQF